MLRGSCCKKRMATGLRNSDLRKMISSGEAGIVAIELGSSGNAGERGRLGTARI